MDRYFVEFREVGESEWWSEGEFHGASATIEYLQNGVEYEVRVIVLNIHGEAIAGPKRATPRGADSSGGQGESQDGEQEGEEDPQPSDTPTPAPTPAPTPTPTPSEPDRLPSAPRNLNAALNGALLDISWSAPADAGSPPFSGYEVHVRVSTGPSDWSSTMEWTRGRGVTSISLVPRSGDLEYEIKVRAVNDAGKGPFIGPRNVTIQ